MIYWEACLSVWTTFLLYWEICISSRGVGCMLQTCLVICSFVHLKDSRLHLLISRDVQNVCLYINIATKRLSGLPPSPLSLSLCLSRTPGKHLSWFLEDDLGAERVSHRHDHQVLAKKKKNGIFKWNKKFKVQHSERNLKSWSATCSRTENPQVLKNRNYSWAAEFITIKLLIKWKGERGVEHFHKETCSWQCVSYVDG